VHDNPHSDGEYAAFRASRIAMPDTLSLTPDAYPAAPVLCADSGVCFHCGLPLRPGPAFSAVIDGTTRAMCCIGCQAVAEAIAANGLTAYYRRARGTSTPARPLDAAERARLAAFDRPAVQARFVTADGARRRATLLLGGLSCAACAWLVESRLGRLPGVFDCRVNFAARRVDLEWEDARTTFSALLSAVRELGFDAAPFDPAAAHAALGAEWRRELRRFGVAALCAMQVMMIATATYFDGETATTRQYGAALDWISLALTLPVVTWCAATFAGGARRALRAGTVTMDVPITLGVWLAFAGSVWATVTREGVVYFDSVTMFVTLLLGSRLLELSAQRRAARYVEQLCRVEPQPVTRLVDGPSGSTHQEVVLASDLAVGDRIRVAPGAVIPVDGVVRTGTSGVDERVLTGESVPRTKDPPQRVVSGSTNIDSPLDIEVSAVGEATVLARIGQLARQAGSAPSVTLKRMNRIAVAFIWGVLVLAALTVAYHAGWRGTPWLPPTIAVLVISCPCALALAVPTALNSALGALLKQGVLVLDGDALLRFAEIRRVVFDKTGTLTTGQLALADVSVFDHTPLADPVALAAALDATSPHPVAAAFRAVRPDADAALEAIEHRTGLGVSGTLGRVRYHLGSKRYLQQVLPALEWPPAALRPTLDKVVYLAHAGGLVARFGFRDELRPDAAAVIEHLRERGLRLTVLSGDQPAAVNDLAARLGIEDARAALDPVQKLAALEALVAAGPGVAAIGDGINDAPMLARADVGITLGAATSYAKLNADVVLLGADLGGLVSLQRMAQRLRRVGRQNLAWALGYNVIALPLALGGIIAPWLAAVLMATSSMVVVINAARLARPG
jgi:Cu2+-exporting ATPase